MKYNRYEVIHLFAALGEINDDLEVETITNHSTPTTEDGDAPVVESVTIQTSNSGLDRD